MKYTFFLTVIFLSIIACTPVNQTVSRISIDKIADISGNWNDTDSKLVAEQMVRDLMYRIWISDFQMEYAKKPTLIVGTVRNKSSEHIQTDTFVKDIERELLNSGKVKFVADKLQRAEVREERLEQQSFASAESAKKLAAELGADFMLNGEITSIIDAADGKMMKYYQINMELIKIETNEIVWIGDKKIKKFISQKKTKW